MNTTRSLLKIGLVANIFEWCEFSLYAYLADIIGQLFFDAADPVSGMVQAFSVFAIGYFARPLGSLFFGVLGDRTGRGRPLKISLMMMAAPTALIGLLPTYQAIGLLAPALLLILRLVQGFAMGAELPLNGCYIFEASPADRKSILTSVVMVSATLGLLLASLIAFLLFSCFDHATLLKWAWRIPFLLTIPLTVFIGVIRRAISDLPPPHPGLPHRALPVLKQSLPRVMLFMLFVTATASIITLWMPAYLIHFLNYPARLARLSHIMTLIAAMAFKLAAGYIAGFLGYQRLIQIGMIATIILICPLWSGLQATSYGVIVTMQLLLACLFGCVNGVLIEALAAQFPPAMRCRGMNLAYTLPTVFLGGATPLICTWMVNKTGLLLFPAFYILFFGLLALPVALRLQRPGRAAEIDNQYREIGA